MAKSPLGRIEMLATQFRSDKKALTQLILGENADFDNPWFEAECGRQPLDEIFAEKMQKIFNQHDLVFNLEVFRSWVIDAVNEPDPIMEELVLELKELEIKVALLTNSVPEFWPVIENRIRGIPEYNRLFLETFDDIDHSMDIKINHSNLIQIILTQR